MASLALGLAGCNGGDEPATLAPSASCASELAVGTGDVDLSCPPPASVDLDGSESDQIQVFLERFQVTLTEDLVVDRAMPGTIVGGDFGDGEIVLAGTTVTSLYVHLDPDPSGTVQADGSLEFDSEVLAVITGSERLDASDDALANGDVLYPEAGSQTQRGLEGPGFPGHQDAVTISDDRRVVLLDVGAASSTDRLRVILNPSPGEEAQAGPEPRVTVVPTPIAPTVLVTERDSDDD